MPWGFWIESELRRFHRGISLAVLFLASVLLVTEVLRYSLPRERELLVGLLLLLALAQLKLFPSLGIGVRFSTSKGSG